MTGLQWLCAAWGLLALSARADGATQKILDCMRANVPPSLQIKEVELVATDRSGAERLLKGRVYASRDKGLVRVLLRISKPRDLDGASYLMRESAVEGRDDIFLYLPAIQRVRRITGASADGSLLGTDFSYNDMKQLQSAFGGTEATLEKPSTVDGRAVQILSLTPAPGTSARYSQVRIAVDREACVALKAEFYEGKTMRKELSAPAAGLQRSEGYWYVSEISMHDLRDKTSTRLTVTGVSSSDKELPSRLFDPTTFFRGN